MGMGGGGGGGGGTFSSGMGVDGGNACNVNDELICKYIGHFLWWKISLFGLLIDYSFEESPWLRSSTIAAGG